MSDFASLNLTGGRSPSGKPMTPVFYDSENPANDNPFQLGLGSEWQFPTSNLQHAVDVAWRWAYLKAQIGLTVSPTLQNDFGEVEAAGEFNIAFEVPMGDEFPERAPTPDFTEGTRPPFIGRYDSYTDFGAYYPVATYTTSMVLTGGFDQLFAAPVVDINLSGCHRIWTRGAGGPVYWMDGILFRLRWRYFASGPGSVEDDIPPQPFKEVFSFPATDADDNLKPLQDIDSQFGLDAEYEGDDGDCVMTLGDPLAKIPTDETAVIMRRHPTNDICSAVQGGCQIAVAKYYLPRKPI